MYTYLQSKDFPLLLVIKELQTLLRGNRNAVWVQIAV